LTPIYVPGGWYCAATKDAYAALRPLQGDIETSRGNVLLCGQNILYLDVAVVEGQLCLAGSGHSSDGAFLWNGDWLKVYAGRPYGTSPCIFGPLGLYVSIEGVTDNVLVFDPLSGMLLYRITKPIGARGIAAVTGSGEYPADLHSQDDWYGRDGFAEYLELGDGVRIGQGANGGLCAKDGDRPLITLEAGDNQFIRGHLDGSTITASAWQRDRTRSVILRLERAELQAMTPAPIAMPAINGPLWVGFFAGSPDAPLAWQTDIPPTALPGNCYLKIANETFYTKDGRVLGRWCAAKRGETLEDIEAKAVRISAEGIRPVAYWDGRMWPRRPNLPSGSWCCVQGYCGVSEHAFEANLSQAVVTTLKFGYPVVVVAQCYTNRDDFTKDIGALVPIFARLAINQPIIFLLPFSGSGRATGLQDHPEVRPLWEQLVASVTLPLVLPFPVPTPPPVVIPPPQPPTIPITRKGDLLMAAIFTDPTKEIITAKAAKPVAGTKLFTLILPDDRVYSCQPDGSSGDRDPGAEGGYERCRLAGNMATFHPVPDKYYTKPFVEVDGL
jgi:hypothetical protein